MDWLTFRDPNNQNKTRVDLYREKQATYTDAFERKAGAYSDALDRATKDPLNPTVKDQREAYTKWVEQNHKTYNAHVQAAYMDWVTMGKKEEVEYYFSVVDNDSAMSRVEASKVDSLSLLPIELKPITLGRNPCVRQLSVIPMGVRNTRQSGCPLRTGTSVSFICWFAR